MSEMRRVFAPAVQERMCHGKRRYPDEISARIAADRYLAQFGSAQRAYPCPNCSGFHLTTRELKGPSRPGSETRRP